MAAETRRESPIVNTTAEGERRNTETEAENRRREGETDRAMGRRKEENEYEQGDRSWGRGSKREASRQPANLNKESCKYHSGGDVGGRGKTGRCEPARG